MSKNRAVAVERIKSVTPGAFPNSLIEGFEESGTEFAARRLGELRGGTVEVVYGSRPPLEDGWRSADRRPQAAGRRPQNRDLAKLSSEQNTYSR